MAKLETVIREDIARGAQRDASISLTVQRACVHLRLPET